MRNWIDLFEGDEPLDPRRQAIMNLFDELVTMGKGRHFSDHPREKVEADLRTADDDDLPLWEKEIQSAVERRKAEIAITKPVLRGGILRSLP